MITKKQTIAVWFNCSFVIKIDILSYTMLIRILLIGSVLENLRNSIAIKQKIRQIRERAKETKQTEATRVRKGVLVVRHGYEKQSPVLCPSLLGRLKKRRVQTEYRRDSWGRAGVLYTSLFPANSHACRP